MVKMQVCFSWSVSHDPTTSEATSLKPLWRQNWGWSGSDNTSFKILMWCSDWPGMWKREKAWLDTPFTSTSKRCISPSFSFRLSTKWEYYFLYLHYRYWTLIERWLTPIYTSLKCASVVTLGIYPSASMMWISHIWQLSRCLILAEQKALLLIIKENMYSIPNSQAKQHFSDAKKKSI